MSRKLSCGIYKISFKQTNKVYIGQSIRVEDRWTEHIRSSFPEKYALKNERDSGLPIHRAIHKYGLDNTKFEIIEICPKEKLDEREQYWIAFYKSDIKQFGYNIAFGGQATFALKREKHSQAKLTELQVCEIKDLLANDPSLSSREIAAKFHITPTEICHINTGQAWFDDNRIYPIRSEEISKKFQSKGKTPTINPEQIVQIRQMRSEGKTYREIAEYFGFFSLKLAYNVCAHIPPYQN